MAIKLDHGRRVEVIDLRISIVVVHVVEHNQQWDKQWTHHARQYLTALQTTLYWCIAPLRAVICIIIITDDTNFI